MHHEHQVEVILEPRVEEVVHFAQPREGGLVLRGERRVHVDEDVLVVRVRVERAHDEHEHALEIDRALRQVACPEEEDRAAARVDARAVEELQRLEVGQVGQSRALEEGAVG